MRRTRMAALAAAAALLSIFLGAPSHATYPERPIRVVVPVPPGGIIDQVVRIITPPMAEMLKQSIIVENRAGASGNIAASYVARSAPDGYTVLAGYSMFHVGNPVMFHKLDWDPVKDFAPVAMLVSSPHVIAVNPKLPVHTLKELVDYARAHPGELNYATSGNGSVPHIGMELFKQKTGVQITHVPYKGAGPAVQDVLSGNVQMTVATPPSLAGFVTTGRLRPLAIAAKSRIPMLPDVPTTAEAGFPGFELEAWVALFAPAGTPKEAVAALSDAARKSLQTSKVKEALAAAGVSGWYLDPAGLDRQVREDIDYWQPVIRKANIIVE
ncbi:Bug family tripartite tricarboxylate transporter substrate binding protein [Bordetella genomosp. 11]|uniref:ABC transporter substrate-binding protein n=1 Tax=Bordetella genomosp. 11 TaxID=1416808 RepID=A0A261UL57_9BORD|nr:tripartite tricarboxylate transporter substrate binding protein [Bordetella genomosp. 11]OZI62619.1 ABC transporter substrate-binding protein [Bordetella genomosp. 11]